MADTAGDVNGEGLSDIIVGAPLYDSPDADEGSAFVFLTNPWFKEIMVEGALTDSVPITLETGNTVDIVDRVFASYTSTVSFTLVETWTPSFDLQEWGIDAGSVMTTANTLSWQATDVTTDTWHVITKTFIISFSPDRDDTITESLWIEHFETQPADRILQFDHEVDRVFIPLTLRNY